MGDQGANYEVQAITRAADILELIQAGRGETSLNGLVSGSGLHKPTVFRMVRNLERIGLVERVPGTERYRLGLRCVELGQAYLEQVDFRREALPVPERLRDAYNETVHLAVLDGHLRVVYLEKLEGKHAIGIMMSALDGARPPTAPGWARRCWPAGAMTRLACSVPWRAGAQDAQHDPRGRCPAWRAAPDPRALLRPRPRARARGALRRLDHHRLGRVGGGCTVHRRACSAVAEVAALRRARRGIDEGCAGDQPALGAPGVGSER